MSGLYDELEGRDGSWGRHTHTILCIKEMASEKLLYSIGSSCQGSMMS